jgi:hypothetical protein
MTTFAIILNIVFAAGIVATIVGGLVWSVATQDRDHGVAAAGTLMRRRAWSWTARPHAARGRHWIAPQSRQVSPAA